MLFIEKQIIKDICFKKIKIEENLFLKNLNTKKINFYFKIFTYLKNYAIYLKSLMI